MSQDSQGAFLPVNPLDELARFFAGLTEHTFLQEFGLGETPVVDYLSGLLARFFSMKAIQRLHVKDRSNDGDELQAVLAAADELPEGMARGEVYRHAGDLALYWTGLFPEGLRRMGHRRGRDALLDYTVEGKRSYLMASHLEKTIEPGQAEVLRRLADDFELFALGLNKVRREWERLPADLG
jgi:hypothetical protein